VQWQVEESGLLLNWLESGGPLVTPPVRKGFGSRLLERLLVSDLGGAISLNYDPAGVKFSITAQM
jgi:two-component sensor histidine kinase